MLDKNLKPIKEIKLPFGTMRFAVNKNEIATVHLGNEDEIQILSFEGKKIRTYFPYSGIQRLVELKAFAKFESELLYKPIRCDDSIFSISSDSISLHTKILFEKPAPKEFLVKPLNFKQMDPPGCMAGVYYYCESKEFISFLFMYNYKGDDGPFHTLFSKKNGSTIIYTDKIENDCYLSKYTPAFKEVTEDGRFITSINATFFHEAIKKNPHLLKKYNITEMSNPIIALIKLKDL